MGKGGERKRTFSGTDNSYLRKKVEDTLSEIEDLPILLAKYPVEADHHLKTFLDKLKNLPKTAHVSEEQQAQLIKNVVLLYVRYKFSPNDLNRLIDLTKQNYLSIELEINGIVDLLNDLNNRRPKEVTDTQYQEWIAKITSDRINHQPSLEDQQLEIEGIIRIFDYLESKKLENTTDEEHALLIGQVLSLYIEHQFSLPNLRKLILNSGPAYKEMVSNLGKEWETHHNTAKLAANAAFRGTKKRVRWSDEDSISPCNDAGLQMMQHKY